MNWDVFITCALTGAGDTTGKSPHVPVTPQQIAESALGAAEAGAAVVHVHVRDPETGIGARATELYAEVVERIRDSGTDVVLNLTAGMGGDLVLGGDEDPVAAGEPMAPTWPGRPSASTTCARCSRRSARSTAAR